MLPLFLIVLVDLIGFGLVIPLLPFYAERFDAAPLTITLLMAAYSFAQFLTAPFWGRLSDRVGRRPVLIASMAGAIVAYVWLGVAYSLWTLFAARILAGAMAGNISAAFAYVADVTTPANRAKGMGLIGAALGLGFIIGPAIGGTLAGSDPLNADYATPCFLAAVLSTIALISTALILKESLSAETRARAAAKRYANPLVQFLGGLKREHIAALILLAFMATFVFAGMEATFALWSEREFGWGPRQNGYLFAGVGLLTVGVQGGAIGALARRFNERSLIVAGGSIFAIGLALIPLAHDLVTLVGAMALLALGFAVFNPSLNSLLSLRAGSEEQGAILGIGRSAAILGRVVGPAWAGILFAGIGRDWPFLGGAIVMAAAVVVTIVAVKAADR